MKEKNIARGEATRTANMNKRRKQILSCAGNIIASEGIDAFTLNRLAIAADVTVPTIHNLIGKKSDIFAFLVEEMLARVEQVLTDQDILDPIKAAEAFIDKLMELFSANEDFYKAAFAAGERSKLFEHQLPLGIFSKSLQLSIKVCINAIKEGYLVGQIDPEMLAQEIFACQRLARHDWVHGYINLESYRQQVLTGMFILFVADASPSFRIRLLEKIKHLKTVKQ